MEQEPENIVLHLLRELRGEFVAVNRRLDGIVEELHDMRAEAAADRGRSFSTEVTLNVMQRRLLRTDERVTDLERRLAPAHS